jgi:hypothetical protein
MTDLNDEGMLRLSLRFSVRQPGGRKLAYIRSHPRTLPVEGFAYDSGRNLVRAEYGYP